MSNIGTKEIIIFVVLLIILFTIGKLPDLIKKVLKSTKKSSDTQEQKK